MSSSPLHTCGDGGRGAKDVRRSRRATVGTFEPVYTSSVQTLVFSPKRPFLQTQNLLCHFSRYTFGRRKRKHDDTHSPENKGPLTSQIPSIQTSCLFGEQGVPSFTLPDIAKKNSKFSALQYSLHRSASRSKEIKTGRDQEEITGQ